VTDFWDDHRRKAGKNRLVFSAILAFLLCVPAFVSSYLLHVAIMILLFGFLASAWNIIGGYAGQHSFGHAAFFGVGAYVSTLLYTRLGISPWIGMLAGAILASVLGMILGYLTFRYKLKGVFFALATFSFAEILRVIVLNWSITNEAMGILIPLKQVNSYRDLLFVSKVPYYYIILFMVIAILLVSYKLDHSKWGYYLKATSEDEEAAGSLGIDILKYKSLALVISSFFTALGGTFYAQYMYYIDPDIGFGIDTTIEMVIRAMFGGLGTVLGPLLGSAVLETVSEVMRNSLGEYKGLHIMFYGAVLIFVMIYFPRGLMGLMRMNRPGKPTRSRKAA
jgi:branched-chain amino acid transport system permease protein